MFWVIIFQFFTKERTCHLFSGLFYSVSLPRKNASRKVSVISIHSTEPNEGGF